MLSFTERMDLGRELAMVTRNKGQHVGAVAKGWNYTRRPEGDATSWEWLCAEARREWRSTVNQARNDFAAACLNPLDDQPEQWEF